MEFKNRLSVEARKFFAAESARRANKAKALLAFRMSSAIYGEKSKTNQNAVDRRNAGIGDTPGWQKLFIILG